MESRGNAYHLAIEKQSSKSNKQVHTPSHHINQVLFAGKNHKGYEWMVEFLSLMHSITLKTKQKLNYRNELLMTQYMLKLLTILSNILISNLQIIDKEVTNKFLGQVVAALRKSPDAL